MTKDHKDIICKSNDKYIFITEEGKCFNLSDLKESKVENIEPLNKDEVDCIFPYIKKLRNKFGNKTFKVLV